MGWDDIVGGILTGGLYNVGKGIVEASDAAGKAGTAVEEIGDNAGTALADIGATVTRLGADMSSFIKDLEKLITIDRLTPRDEDTLWDEELARLKGLRALETALVGLLNALDATDDDVPWWMGLFGAAYPGESYQVLLTRAQLAAVRDAIHGILYEEPGVVPTSIHNVQLILERFNTLEQPRLEEILDSVNDNLDESDEILQEVKKLFVVKTWKEIPAAELLPESVRELEALEASLANVDTLIAGHMNVAAQLRHALVQVQPAKFKLPGAVGPRATAGGAAVAGSVGMADAPEVDGVLPAGGAAIVHRFPAAAVTRFQLQLS